MLHGQMLHGQMLHGQMLHGQMLHGQMLHGQMLHGQMLHGQGWFHKREMSSTVLSLVGWWGGWGKITAISAQHSWNWA